MAPTFVFLEELSRHKYSLRAVGVHDHPAGATPSVTCDEKISPLNIRSTRGVRKYKKIVKSLRRVRRPAGRIHHDSGNGLGPDQKYAVWKELGRASESAAAFAEGFRIDGDLDDVVKVPINLRRSPEFFFGTSGIEYFSLAFSFP